MKFTIYFTLLSTFKRDYASCLKMTAVTAQQTIGKVVEHCSRCNN